MIRLICIDVDGTLVGSSGVVLPAVWAAAERARARGIRLAICSGRPAFGITRGLAERLDPDGWHVFQNGASLVHLPTGRSMSAEIPKEIIEMLVVRARSSGRVLELYTDTEYAVESTGDAARQHAEVLGVPFEPRPFESLTNPVVRAQWLITDDQVSATLKEPCPGLEVAPSTSPIIKQVIFVNMTRSGIDKASAARSLAREYDIPLEEVMLVGDGHNDIAAMKVVGFPVAMGNAPPDVQEVCRFKVGDVDDGGLAEALTAALTA